MTKKLRPENDIEKLSNHQLILLAFLIAMISSIASAMAVVRFYERHPYTITKIINQENKQLQELAVLQKANKVTEIKPKPIIKTVYIKESDLIALSVDKNKKYLFDIFLIKKEKKEKKGKAFLKDGKIYSSKFDFEKNNKITLQDGTELKKLFLKDSVIVWKPLEKIKDKKIIPLPKEKGNLKLGSTVINIYSTSFIKKNIITKKINETHFVQDSKSGNDLALVVGLSKKILGISVGSNVYTFEYFNKK